MGRVLWAFPIPVALLLAGWQSALMVAGLDSILHALSLVANRVTFTFADGFLPFRLEDAWPHGVREDDDVRWNWSPPTRQPSIRREATERILTRPGASQHPEASVLAALPRRRIGSRP